MVALATQADLTRFGYDIPANADALLERASARLRLAAGHQMVTPDTSTVTFMPQLRPRLRLWQFPARAVHSVIRNDTGEDITSQCALDGNDLLLPSYGSFLYPPDVLSWFGFTSITVTYSHGWAVVPDELVELVCAVAVRMSGTKPDRDPAIVAQTVGDVSQQINPAALGLASGLLPGEVATIRRVFYRRG